MSENEEFSYCLETSEDASELVESISRIALEIIHGELMQIKEPTERFLISNRVAAYIFQANFNMAMNAANEKIKA